MEVFMYTFDSKAVICICENENDWKWYRYDGAPVSNETYSSRQIHDYMEGYMGYNKWAATWQNQQNECTPSED